MTIERPMFPPTRRTVLNLAAAGASALAVLPAALPTAAATADPVFALIAEKRAADIAHGEAIDALTEAEDNSDFSTDASFWAEADDNCEAACHFVHEIDWKLATTAPTTLAGVAAVLRFANAIEDGGMEWPNSDAIGVEGWHYQLRATMAQAIEAIISKSGGAA
jgi:hypothetical protein